MASHTQPDPQENNGNVPETKSKLTSLLDLPDKVLISIFKMIPLQNLDDIIELSPHWDKLVQDNVPVEAHLTDIGFRIALHYFVGYDELPKYRIKIIHSRVLDETLPELKSPEDLKILEFATHTELATYKSLTSKAVNLREIHFGYGSLSGALLSTVDVDLPNLKLINIVDRHFAMKDLQNPDVLSINILGFLKKSFPSIESICVSTIASRPQTIDYTKELLKFIQNNFATLRSIRFNVITSILKGRNEEGQSDICDNFEFPPEEEFDLNQLRSAKLEELELSFGNNFIVGLEQWTAILNNLTSLRHLNIGFDKHLPPSFYITPITQSVATLVSLQLGVEVFNKKSNQRRPMDCSIFENCSNLKMIVLVGPPVLPDNAELRPPSKELLHLGKLPKQLVGIAIENIFLETGQLMDIMRGVMMKERSLKKLSLRNVGTEGEYGATLTMIDTWISTNVLKEIIVKGVNGDDMRLHEYEHLLEFGLKSPVASCTIHVCFNPDQMEFRKPTESLL